MDSGFSFLIAFYSSLSSKCSVTLINITLHVLQIELVTSSTKIKPPYTQEYWNSTSTSLEHLLQYLYGCPLVISTGMDQKYAKSKFTYLPFYLIHPYIGALGMSHFPNIYSFFQIITTAKANPVYSDFKNTHTFRCPNAEIILYFPY